jgi:hypothetical protein
MGADLTYECRGGNLYRLTFTLYRDCAGIPAPTAITINVSSSCYAPRSVTLFPTATSPVDISPVCSAVASKCVDPVSAFPGVEKWTYIGTITLNGPCADWYFTYTECCRNAAITNIAFPGGESMFIDATLNNLVAPCNSSPVFSNYPILFAFQGKHFIYNQGAHDPDGDSLVFQLTTPRSTSLIDTVQYLPGFSPQVPLTSGLIPPSPPVIFDILTGAMTLLPVNLEVTV